MNIKNRKIIAYLLFGIYSTILLWAILFKMMPPITGIEKLYGIRSINLYPFDFDRNPHHHFWETMLNFLAFAPIGLLLKQAKLRWNKVIIIGLLLSLFCEITQYILMIGVTDITDIITNTCGTIFGVLIFITIRKLKRTYKKHTT